MKSRVSVIEKTLLYVQESLANHTEDQLALGLYEKLKNNYYENERAFIDHLTDPEMIYLNQLLEHEMDYASQANDVTRVVQLNGVYEQLL